MMLTHVTSWKMRVGDMCTIAAGDVAIRMGSYSSPSDEIQLFDRKGRTHTTYTGLCTCKYSSKYISELIPRQYLAELCSGSLGCNDIKVVDMVTHKVHTARSGGILYKKHVELCAICSGPGEGSLLICEFKSYSVIELQWNEGQKQLKEIRRVRVPGAWVKYMCYMPHIDLVILSRGDGMVQAVKLQGRAGQPPVWQLQGKVLGKDIDPRGVSSYSVGRLYVADWHNSRVLLLNGYTGEVIQQLLQDAGLGTVYRVCCLSNPHQLLVDHDLIFTLYNITSQ